MMKNKVLLVGFWTMSMVVACQGAQRAHQTLGMERIAINASAASPMSKLTKLAQLEDQIKDANPRGVKEIRALQKLQNRVQKDQKQILPGVKKPGRTLFN